MAHPIRVILRAILAADHDRKPDLALCQLWFLWADMIKYLRQECLPGETLSAGDVRNLRVLRAGKVSLHYVPIPDNDNKNGFYLQ